MATTPIEDALSERRLMREVNERVWSLSDSAGEPLGLTCECGSPACDEVVHLSRFAYEKTRWSPVRFIVARGHEQPEMEQIVELTQHYAVVQRLADQPMY